MARSGFLLSQLVDKTRTMRQTRTQNTQAKVELQIASNRTTELLRSASVNAKRYVAHVYLQSRRVISETFRALTWLLLSFVETLLACAHGCACADNCDKRETRFYMFVISDLTG